MRRLPHTVFGFQAAAIAALFVPGCGKSIPSTPPGPLSKTLALWEAGDQAGAVASLLAVDWGAPDLLSGEPAFALSAQDYSELSRASQNQINADIIRVAGLSIGLAKHALSLGDASQVAGDEQAARAHYHAVEKFGHASAGQDRLGGTRNFGQAIVAMADERLSKLP